MEAGKRTYEKPNIKGDRVNIVLLLLMYSFQGVVYGLSQAFSIIFQNRNVSFADQAEFSLVNYPYCLKLLWAPIVDCVFSKRIGRRKTWITPTQYLLGIILLVLSIYLDDWLGSEDGSVKPRIRLLTVIFFTCSFLSAVQDVALDGWSLTMLQRRNVGYSITCQNVGMTVGQFIAYVGFIILDSKDFCNVFRSVPQDHGFVSLSEFLFLWSMVFLISTTFVFLFKKDNSLEAIDDENGECRLGLAESYRHMWNIFRLRPMIVLCFLLFTYYVGFGPQHGVAHLKMIDAGISSNSLVLLTVPALPAQIILSVVLRHSLIGPRSTHSFITYYIQLLIAGILTAVVLFFSPLVRDEQESMPSWYYCVLFVVYNARIVIRYLMQLALGAFFCRLSDPRYGGIYLTLLNAVLNIGINWPTTLSLWFVDLLTVGKCVDEDGVEVTTNCLSKFDGFYTETAIFAVFGGLWLWWGRKQIYELEKLDSSEWVFERKKAEVVEREMLPVMTHTVEVHLDDRPRRESCIRESETQSL